MGKIRKRNGKFFIDYYANGRRIRKVVDGSHSLAEIVLKKREVEVAEGKHLDIKKEMKIKFEDFADEYVEIHCKINNRSWQRSVRPNIRTLNKFFAGKYLYEITPLMVEKFKIERSKEVTPATTNRGLACLRSMFNKAIRWGRFEGVNPVKGIEFFKENNQRLRFLEKEEIARLLSNSDVHIKAIITVALNTGMRRGEILNLKWHDLDFKRDVIRLETTKNGEKREIPMNSVVRDTFIKTKKNPNSPYVFPNEFGKPFSNLRKSFFTALKKSGIINFRFHDLRHTFASQLVMCGVDLNTVRELLGHKSLEMTLRYSHLSPDHKKRAVDVLAQQVGTVWALKQKKENTKQNIDSVIPTVSTNCNTFALSSNR